MYLFNMLLLFTLIVYSREETFDEYFKYVSDTIAAASDDVLPTNNEALYKTNDTSVIRYGRFDIIIIGGGAAGSVLARRLSEVRQWKVLLLEAGGEIPRILEIPALNNVLFRSEINWGYFTTSQSVGCQGMINNSCIYPRGKVLGGSASINGIVSARGIAADYNNWANLVHSDWSYQNVLPYFNKIEKNDISNLDNLYHGTSGLIHNNYTSPPSLHSDTFIQGNIQNGINYIDYNGKDILGVSRIQFNIKGNKRDNSATGYLDPVRDRTNLNVSINSFVTKILLKNNVAYGVEFTKNGQTYQALACKEVILSAGSINSPQLLLLSGIGPADELTSLGIPVVLNLPAVGKYLEDHLMFVNFFVRTNLTSPNLPLYQNLQRYVDGLTPLTNGGRLENLAFISTSNNSKIRDVEYLFIPPPFSVPPNPTNAFNFRDEFAKVYKEYNTLTDISIFTILLKPKSRGSITLKSKSPIDFPLINTGYYSNPDDLEAMYKGIQYLFTLLKTDAFKKVNATYISKHPGCEQFTDDREYWYCALKSMTTTEYHPTGTTRMGRSSEDSVVNYRLRVHNTKRLRVVDAGVMPETVSGHTCFPTYMIAEKASRYIKLDHGILI